MTSLWTNSIAHPQGYREARACQLALHTPGRIVDVREPDEFVGKLGHIPTAQLTPLDTLATASCHWDLQEPVVLVCRSGARSARACTWLLNNGFTRIINLTGGMVQYVADNLPVSHEPSTTP